jgi:SAM-dependent methyltransferase
VINGGDGMADNTTNRDEADDAGGAQSLSRMPHAALDLASRRLKGLKIERLLSLGDRPALLRILEVGTGSGGVAHYFGTHPSLRCDVDAVDVCDNRIVTEGYRYQDVEGTQLPFADAHFDVVLSNHVIEHVGGESAQRDHLMELRRVLKADGVGYLAVPNRWMLVEPHFKLLFLSWLPQSIANRYVRFMRKGTYYDCRPLTVGRVESMLRHVGFSFAQLHGEALIVTCEVEHPDAVRFLRFLRFVPKKLYAILRGAFPTLIYKLKPTSCDETDMARSHAQ